MKILGNKRKLLRIISMFLILLSTVIGGFLGFWITGSVPRNYNVLDPSRKIANYTVEQLAEVYKPILYQEDNIKPEPTKNFYEIVNKSSSLIIAYRVYWSDEYYPNAIMDNLYRFFRTIYYGDPADIETIEFEVDIISLKIRQIAFEILKPGTTEKLPGHRPVRLIFKGPVIYLCYGDTNRTLNFNPFEGTHLVLQVNTWNHLFSLEETPRGERYDLPLVFMTDKEYMHYKMVRRSAILLKQKEPMQIAIIIIISLIFTIYMGLYFVIFRHEILKKNLLKLIKKT